MSWGPKVLTEFLKKSRRGRCHYDSRKQQHKKVPGIMASSEFPCKPYPTLRKVCLTLRGDLM